MKVHIMTDMEGCAGIINARDYIYPESKYYEEARELATLEVSAAVEGALEAGATEVLVADGHGGGAMSRSLLHPRAKLLAGRPWPRSNSTFGLDGTFAAAMIIGQHAKANTDGGHICHTMSFSVEDYTLNGLSVGEMGLWMAVAGYFGVPVVMLSGDQAACDEARTLVPNIEVAAVKYGLKRGTAAGLPARENEAFNAAAVHMHPNQARALIREHAYRAVKRIPEIIPFRMGPLYKLAIALRPEEGKKVGRKFAIKAADFLDLMERWRNPRTHAGKPRARAGKQAPQYAARFTAGQARPKATPKKAARKR